MPTFDQLRHKQGRSSAKRALLFVESEDGRMSATVFENGIDDIRQEVNRGRPYGLRFDEEPDFQGTRITLTSHEGVTLMVDPTGKAAVGDIAFTAMEDVSKLLQTQREEAEKERRRKKVEDSISSTLILYMPDGRARMVAKDLAKKLEQEG